MRRLGPALLALTVVAGGCSAGRDGGPVAAKESAPREPSSTAAPTSAALEWGRCDNEVAAAAGLRCATLEVPLDHDDPDRGTVEIAVARRAATGPADRRIGSLVMNPGGPGASGVEFLAGAAGQFPATLGERFDLVSFDPRGVGASSPVRCLDDAEKDAQFEGDLSPDTPDEVDRAFRDQAEFLAGCRRRSGDLLRHMSTADVAEDLDDLRAALGDDRLTFLGFSYGTSIAATYATTYPDRVRALVLDGSVSPTADEEATTLAQVRGFERTLARFVEACNGSSSCALAPDAAGAVTAARAGLEAAPVRVGDGASARTLGPDQFDIGLATALYDSATWGVAADAVKNLRTGGAKVLMSLADRQTGRKADGTFDNSADAQTMVACADRRDRPGRAEAEAAARRLTAEVPGFASALGWSVVGCVGWPTAARPTPTPSAEDAPDLLVVGTVGDPATPYEWSQQMVEALGRATLLTYEGDGHTAFLRGGPCIDDAVVDYLVDLELPPPGTRCPAGDEGDAFGGLRDEIVSQLTDAGVPAKVAECVVDNLVEQLGEQRLNELVLGEKVEELTRYITAATLECATGG